MGFPSTHAGYLNLGCGKRFLPDWTNVDMRSTGPGVIAHNLTKPLPFDEGMFELVYLSHSLEHFDRKGGLALIRQCARVLAPGGVLRIVVPDLERLARSYLHWLEQATNNSPHNRNVLHANYEWAYLMLYDQAIRTRPGGGMLDYLQRDEVPNRKFVVSCCGLEISRHLDAKDSRKKSGWRKLFSRQLRDKLWRTIAGRRYDALRLGQFRLSGEVHQCMYDRYSLARLLDQCGMHEVTVRSAAESAIADWNKFHLDTNPDGTVYKPESLFVEASKPKSAARVAA